MEIQILRNRNNGNVGWRLGQHGKVFQGGIERVDNGFWDLDDEFNIDSADEALGSLTDSDGEQLLVTIEQHIKDTEEREARKQETADSNAKSLDEFIVSLKTAPYGARNFWKGRTFIRDSRSGRVCYSFRKRGGYRNWLFPVSDTEVRGIITGTHELRYTIGTNYCKIIEVK